jgi:hypothetical protein
VLSVELRKADDRGRRAEDREKKVIRLSGYQDECRMQNRECRTEDGGQKVIRLSGNQEAGYQDECRMQNRECRMQNGRQMTEDRRQKTKKR